jgi:hypothetical protein
VFVIQNKDNPADANLYSGNFNNGCIWRGKYYANALVPGERCRQ